jgi:hypothetical protein
MQAQEKGPPMRIPVNVVHIAMAFCIMAFLVAAAGAASAPARQGQSGKNGPVTGTIGQSYTMSQTLSDQAQENTIAFDALAFLTGDACSDTFLPPGKVADYAGFQYLRDNDATGMGHNTDFVTRASDNVLYILNEDQLAAFSTLAAAEAPLSSRYAYMRFPLMTAFRAQLEGDLPAGSGGLDKSAVMAYSAGLYDVDASISLGRAETYAGLIRSLNESQRAYLDGMKSGGMLSWPVVDASAVLKNGGQGNSVAMRTYASEMFAWYAGSVDADVYFCPERQATYFGSFYMKDRPAMGNAGYSISTSLTGDSGAAFLDALTDTQRSSITGLVDLQRADLNEIVSTRQAIAMELRRAIAGESIDEHAVRSLSARYGELDGEISYLYAMHFAEVGKTLSADQKQKLMALRNLDGYTCEGAYLYSQQVSVPQDIPTDFLFGVGDSSGVSSWVGGQQQVATGQEPGAGDGGQGQGKGPGTGQGDRQQAGTGSPSGQGTGQGQQRHMPVEEIITQLEQKGYDVSEARQLLDAGDRDGAKTWLDTFRKENPGVVEAIEGTGTKNGQGRKGEAGNPDAGGPSRGQGQGTDMSPLGTIRDWFSQLLGSFRGGSGQESSPKDS